MEGGRPADEMTRPIDLSVIVGEIDESNQTESGRQATSLRPLRNAALRGASDDPALTNATTDIADCCARAASGHAAAPPLAMPAIGFLDSRLPDALTERLRGFQRCGS
jgi:hypothetical protein